MTEIGHNIIAKENGTIFTCVKCGDVCAYIKGSFETLGEFQRRVNQFKKKHGECRVRK